MTKHTVDLKINPYSYNKFPIGCRSILIGDKLYITGGKDSQKYYIDPSGIIVIPRGKNKF